MSRIGKRCRSGRRKGFTLIEVVIAVALLTIVLIGVFSAVAFSYSASVSSEQLNTAKNIANYAVEYLRSRNVTHSVSVQDLDPSATFYAPPGTQASSSLPGIVDLAGEPLSINAHPSTPGDSDPNSKKSVWSCLQGYVSLHDDPQNGDTCEDPNGVIKNEGANTWNYVDGTKYPAEAGRWDPYCIRFPLDGSDPSNRIMGFSASSAYTDSQWKLYGTSAMGDRHFSNSQAVKSASRSYTGFRVFTVLTARSRDPDTYQHVEYYDVDVTVYWMQGTTERSYAVHTQIATY